MTAPESATSARKLAAAEREKQATAMRLQGLTYLEIGERLGVTESAAYRAVKRAKARTEKVATETAEEIRATEDARLLLGLRVIMQHFYVKDADGKDVLAKGALGAVNALVRLSESRRKLWGVDAPTVHDINVHEPTQFVIGGADPEKL